MSLKIELVERAVLPGANLSALCREFGVTRPTAYKWIRRFKKKGYSGLEEKSRRPHSAPYATAEDVVVAIMEARVKHPRWGAKKLAKVLRAQFGEMTPSESTVERVLRRFGKLRQRRRKRPLNVVERAPVRSRTPAERRVDDRLQGLVARGERPAVRALDGA